MRAKIPKGDFAPKVPRKNKELTRLTALLLRMCVVLYASVCWCICIAISKYIGSVPRASCCTAAADQARVPSQPAFPAQAAEGEEGSREAGREPGGEVRSLLKGSCSIPEEPVATARNPAKLVPRPRQKHFFLGGTSTKNVATTYI